MPLSALIAALWSEKWLIVGVGALITVLGAVFIARMPSQYVGEAQVLALYEDAYVHRPIGQNSAGQSLFDVEQVVEVERNMLASAALRRSVLETVGLATLYPDVAAAIDGADPRRQALLERQALRALNEDFSVGVEPKSPVLTLRFVHEDPEVAALTANAFLDAYLSLRRERLAGPPVAGLLEERTKAEARLAVLHEQLTVLLEANAIGDYDAERQAAAERTVSLAGQLYATQARRLEVDAQLAAVRGAQASVARQIDVFVEDNSSARLQSLILEREEKLAGYDADSQVIQEIDGRIARLSAAINQGGAGNSMTRRGPNPVFQDLQTQRFQLEAEAASLVTREAALQSQIEETRARQRALQGLSPQIASIVRAQDALGATIAEFMTREEQARALEALATQSIDAVRVVERALPPMQGVSVKLPLAILTVLGAGLAALMAGTLASVLRMQAERAHPRPGAAWSATRVRPSRRAATSTPATPHSAPNTNPAPGPQPDKEPWAPTPLRPAVAGAKVSVVLSGERPTVSPGGAGNDGAFSQPGDRPVHSQAENAARRITAAE